MTIEIQETTAEIFSCVCCESLRLDSLLENVKMRSSSINLSSTYYEWHHKIKQCKDCGHIFNSTQPNDAFCKKYYSDKLPHRYEDYSNEKRISFIKQFVKQSDLKILDYGSNAHLPFHDRMAYDLNADVKLYDIKSELSIKPDYGNWKPSLVSSYFCLEHLTVTGLKEFLTMATRVLVNEGYLLIEVPCLLEYFCNNSGIMHEHQQHFTPYSLNKLVSSYGFTLVAYSYDHCSREFGFSSVFVKTDKAVPMSLARERLVVSSQSFLKGYENYLGTDEYARRIAGRIATKQPAQIYIWGINDNYLHLKRYLKLKTRAIDSDKLKFQYVANDDTSTTVEEFKKSLSSCDNSQICLVVTATSHFAAILSEIEDLPNSSSLDIVLYDPTSK